MRWFPLFTKRWSNCFGCTHRWWPICCGTGGLADVPPFATVRPAAGSFAAHRQGQGSVVAPIRDQPAQSTENGDLCCRGYAVAEGRCLGAAHAGQRTRMAFSPIVIGPTHIPIVNDPARASQHPTLAVLSALAHGPHLPTAAAADVAESALFALETRPDLIADPLIYSDLILGGLIAAVRDELTRRNPMAWEPQSPVFRKIWDEGKVYGKAEGRAQALLQVMRARGLRPSPGKPSAS